MNLRPQMCNVCEHRAHRSSSLLLLFHIFLISGLSKSTAGCLAWFGSEVALSLGWFIRSFAFTSHNLSRACKIRASVCVFLSHSFSVAYFILAILFTVSDECISSFVTSSSASCDLFLSLSLFTCSFYLHRVITHFSFTLDSLLLLPQNEQHLLLTAKRWIENRWEYLFLSCKFSSKVLEMATAGLACFWVCFARKKHLYIHTVGDRINNTQSSWPVLFPIRTQKMHSKKTWKQWPNLITSALQLSSASSLVNEYKCTIKLHYAANSLVLWVCAMCISHK